MEEITMKKGKILITGMLIGMSFACSQQEPSGAKDSITSQKKESKPNTFTIEKIEGAQFVHNTGKIWGDSQPLRLEFIQQLGRPESGDGDSTFYKPTDIALDQEGNLYVLDSGNSLIKKFTPEGRFLTSFGGEGQGPGEFQFMEGIAVDFSGQMYITDKGTNAVKIMSPEGEEVDVLHPGGRPAKIGLLQSGEMVFTKSNQESDSLILIIDKEGKQIKGYGKDESYEDFDSYRYFNKVYFAIDNQDNIFIAYATRNKIEKYSLTEGKVLSITRPLNFAISQEITYREKQFGPRKIDIPFVNYASASIALDEEERIWVLSFNRQLKYEEMGLSIVYFDGDGQFEGSQSLKTSGETKIDAYVFHVFNSEGHFLGEIPLHHHGGPTRIFNGFLYILEPRHTMSVYIYRIIQ